MSPEQEQTLKRVKEHFVEEIDTKFRKGSEEHGGSLNAYSALQLVEFALDEAKDLVVYLDELREKLRAAGIATEPYRKQAHCECCVEDVWAGVDAKGQTVCSQCGSKYVVKI